MAERLNTLSNIIEQSSRLRTVRARTKLDAKQFKDLLFESGKYQEYIEPFFEFLDNNKAIFTHHNIERQTRSEMREQAGKMAIALTKFAKIDLIKQPLKLLYVAWAVLNYDLGLEVKTFLHYFLYVKTLILFQSSPKHQELIQNAMSLKDWGCFGLTEFHHGSYSKEVQTLSTYDHKTQEFVLTTQGQKGMKYWIGAAAEIANMAIIWAQLVIDGKSQGPHPFVVPIRCKKTHKVLPGIIIGDCGPKNGLDYIDNGYIIMDGVRIPRQNLLGKIGSVDENGIYNTLVQNPDSRFGIHMSPLSGGRGLIAFTSAVPALKAITVALRYACNRKQFDNAKKTDEVLIIDYGLTKNRLIPQLAQTIVQIHPGFQLAKAYFGDPAIFNDFKYIAELHAISAAAKARFSWNATTVAQETRSVLGGHGYSAFSNFSSYFHDLDVNNTWEGDNHMLLQQTSKYLMSTIGKQAKTKIVDLSFVWQPTVIDEDKIQENLRSLDVLGALLKDLIVAKYKNAKEVFDNLSKEHKDKESVWLNFHAQAGNTLALTFADYYAFIVTSKVAVAAKDPQNKDFFFKCLLLWGFNLLESERYGSIDLRKALRKEIVALSQELVEPAIIATDILMPSSHISGSVFGNFDDGGLQDYLNKIYTSKDTFTRAPYYSQIIKERNL